MLNSTREMVIKHVCRYYDCYEIGKIEKGAKKVAFEKHVNWI